MTKYVEWAEPYHTLKDGSTIGPVYCRLSVDNAIKSQKVLAEENHPIPYEYPSDQDALDDFMIVHWGRIIEVE